MSKKAKKRPTEISWDSDDDLLKEDASGVTAFSKAKGDDEEIDEEALLQIEVDEEIEDGDTFQILGLETSQEALDYEDTVQEDAMEGTTDTDQSFSNIKEEIPIKKEPLPIKSSVFIKKDSDSDDDDIVDHRQRFKSERKMISLVSSKYSKPIPETLEVTPEMEQEIKKFEKTAPVKQRLGPKGNKNRPQNQNKRQNQGRFGPRFPGNQNIRGQGPTRPAMNQRPLFPHELPAGNQYREPVPGAQPNQESLLGPAPQMPPEPRPLLRPNIHVNPEFRGRLPMPEPFAGQPHPFNPGQQFHPPPPHLQPREAWPPQHPGPNQGGYPPPQQNQPPFSGPQPLYPPASAPFNPRPGPPQPLIPTSSVPPHPHPHPHHPHAIPQHPPVSVAQHFRPPFSGPPGQGPHPQGPNVPPQRFMSSELRPGFNQAPPDLHIQFTPMNPQGQRPQNPPNQGEQVRPQVFHQIRPQTEQQVRPQGGMQVRPQGGNIRPQGLQVRPHGGNFRQQGIQNRPQGGNFRPQGGNVRPQGRQIRPQVGLKRAKGVFGNAGAKMTGVGRGQSKQLQSRLKPPLDARQSLSALRESRLPKMPGFNPKPKQLVSNQDLAQGNKITVVNSRGLKRQSTESPNVVPVKQVKSEDNSMEPVDPQLQRALEEQKRQREAIKAKKEENRLALANKKRQELMEKLAQEGKSPADIEKHIAAATQPQGQKISVLGTQYPNTSVSQNATQFTNIVPVQTTVVGSPPTVSMKNRPIKKANFANRQQSTGMAQPTQKQQGNVAKQQGQGQKTIVPGVQGAKQGMPMGQLKQQVVQNKNKSNIGQGQVQKGQNKPINIVRHDSQGRVVKTYSAMPTTDSQGKTVFKLKIQDTGVQKRTVPNTPTQRTVIAGSLLKGQGQPERQVIAHGNFGSPESERTVVATGRTINIGTNPHLRSRKVSVEGLTTTTQEAKLLGMVKNVGGQCDEIKIIPTQRRAILTFQNIEMATKFVKKYNRSMVDLTHIQVKEVPE